MAQRIYKFDNAKFVLIFLVVVGHVIDVDLPEWHNFAFLWSTEVARNLFIYIYSFHMPLFIFLAGLFAKRDEEKLNGSRVISLILMGFVCKILFSLMVYYSTGEIAFSLFSNSSIPWFLFALAAMYVLSWALRKVNMATVLVMAILVALMVGYDHRVADRFYLSRIVVFFPFYWVGFCLSAQQVRDRLSHPALKVAAVIVLVGAAFVIARYPEEAYEGRIFFTAHTPYADIAGESLIGVKYRLIAYAISAVMGAAVLTLMPDKKIPFCSWAGTKTLQTYIFHIVFVRLFALTPIPLDIIRHAPGEISSVLLMVACAIPIMLVTLIPVFDWILSPLMPKNLFRKKKEADS